jgi:hypothetical protein
VELLLMFLITSLKQNILTGIAGAIIKDDYYVLRHMRYL